MKNDFFFINQFSQNPTSIPGMGAGAGISKCLYSKAISDLRKSDNEVMVAFYREWWPSWGVSVLTVCLPRLQALPSPPRHPGALRLFSQGSALPASCRPRSSTQSLWPCRLPLRTFSPEPCGSAASQSPPKTQNQNVPLPPATFRCQPPVPSSGRARPLLSQSVWKLDAFPRGHRAHNSLTACVSRDCGFLFTDQPLAPDTK